MQETSKAVTTHILNQRQPREVLDAPCGVGWLGERLAYAAEVDGIDLFATEAGRNRYRSVWQKDLDYGLPKELPYYDCIACCEGIEHFGNPDLFFKTAKAHLKSGGFLLVTTPNVWYPAAKLQYLVRGFFPGFPCLVGRIQRGVHMHIMPWSYPHLYLYLTLNGFKNITLHAQPLGRAKYMVEKLLAIPQYLYCRQKWKKSGGEERRFWETAMSPGSLHGRHLIVTAEL